MPSTSFTVPGLSPASADTAISALQDRLMSLLDLGLTLKHIHWNVVGPSFIAVHQMLDPQVDQVREMADAVAERIAALGGEPIGTPGHLVANRTWGDYALTRDTTQNHLVALDGVYTGVITDHRTAQTTMSSIDPVTEDLLIGQIGQLEQHQWFVRAHLEDASGTID